MNLTWLDIARMNLLWRWREWRNRPRDQYVDLARVNRLS